jgi:3-hydroxybutyryl-CoA dehydrogenase
MRIHSVAVIGAGVMGCGVAQALAQVGQSTILLDISEAALQRAQAEIKKNIRFQGLFRSDKTKLDVNAIVQQIQFSSDYHLLNNVDCVIENVTEKWEIKRQVYEQIDAICPARCLFGVNTSAIPITQIASVTRRAAQVVGVHFMNPVPLKPVVEVIRGYHTSDATIEAMQDFLASFGKESIVINDSPGFVTNRVMMLTINEAIFLLQEQVAAIEDIDRLFKTCFGHKMGPLETADLIGLDTVLLSIEVLYEQFQDGKYRPCPLLKKMVSAGLYGQKSGQGFYIYPNAWQ